MLEGVPPALEAEQHSVLDGYTTLALKNISYEEEQQQQQQQQQQQDLSYGEAQQQQQQKQDLSYEEAQQQQQQQQQQREEEEEHEGGVWSVHSKEGRAHSDRSPEGALALSSSHELRSVTMVCVFVVGLGVGVGVGVWVSMGVGVGVCVGVCLCLWWVVCLFVVGLGEGVRMGVRVFGSGFYVCVCCGVYVHNLAHARSPPTGPAPCNIAAVQRSTLAHTKPYPA